jgi:CelD/BcsL family acetyltransferase involved in cellulose biosynthesis
LNDSFDEYLSSLDKPFSKKLKYDLRSLNRDFNVEVSLPEDERSLLAFFKTFLDLHIGRVENRGSRTLLSNKEFQTFYYCVAKAAYQEGHLRLVALKLDREITAVLFGIVYAGTFFFINIGYRPYSKYSLGLVLPALCIESSIESGLEYFDLLGGTRPYKEDLGGVNRGGLCIEIVKPSRYLENLVREIVRRTAGKILSRRMINKIKKVVHDHLIR